MGPKFLSDTNHQFNNDSKRTTKSNFFYLAVCWSHCLQDGYGRQVKELRNTVKAFKHRTKSARDIKVYLISGTHISLVIENSIFILLRINYAEILI